MEGQKFALMDSGELSAIISGLKLMPMSFVDRQGMLLQVSEWNSTRLTN